MFKLTIYIHQFCLVKPFFLFTNFLKFWKLWTRREYRLFQTHPEQIFGIQKIYALVSNSNFGWQLKAGLFLQ